MKKLLLLLTLFLSSTIVFSQPLQSRIATEQFQYAKTTFTYRL